MLVCLNGQFIPHEHASLSTGDGAYLFGDSLFETIKARGKKILLRMQHLDRLEQSAQLLTFPFQRQAIETALHQLAEHLSAPCSRLRLTLSRGDHQGLALPKPARGWFLLTAVPYRETTAQEREDGVSCVLAPNHRVNPLDHLPQLKRGNYADCLYAADYARRKGAREALFVDTDGTLLEGHSSNIFALINRRLVTPPLGHLVLDGIMRRQVISAATELGILVVERPLKLEEVSPAEEVFLTNSLIDLLPVCEIEGKPIKRGECWREIRETLRLRIEG